MTFWGIALYILTRVCIYIAINHKILTVNVLIFFFTYLFYLFTYLFIWLHRVLVAARGTFSCGMRIFLVVARGVFSCGMWDLVPWPGIEPRPPALETQSLSHWTTREVSMSWFLIAITETRAKKLFHIGSSKFPALPLQNLDFVFTLQ